MMHSRFMLIFSAISGFLFVALGALGSHVLSNTLSVEEMAWVQIGLKYQGFHTIAILFLAVMMQLRASLWFYWSGAWLTLGVVLFCGSLYCLALSHLAIWSYITPIGGGCFLIGWLFMFIGALRLRSKAKRYE